MSAPPPATGHCKSCKAPIIWIKTAAGKAQPLDAKPEKRVILVWSGGERVAEVVDTYLVHFATCPQGKEWRRP